MKKYFNGEVIDMTPEEISDLEATRTSTANIEYKFKRMSAYPSIQEQLDMQYWDSVNGTTTWADAIAAVKTQYPKEG